MSELHRGDPLQVSIETATIDGSGVARVDGQVVFVPGALPGERCSVRIAHVGRSAVFAQLLSVLTPSAHRVEPDCPYFPRCGGCALRHMDYEQELALKQAHVQSCLTRIGGQTISALPITGAAQTDGYRNKVQFPVQEQDGRPVAGFFSGKTHRVIPVRHCRIQPDCADAIRGAVLAWMEQYHIRAYDEQTHTGYIRHIYIRFGAESGQILVCLVANCAQLPKKKQLVAALLAAEPGITTIVFSPNTKKGNTVLGTEFHPLYGDGTITDTLCGLQFRLSAPAFYQVNHAQAERLYEKAVQLAGLTGNETVLDLYCGTGTITLCLARHAKRPSAWRSSRRRSRMRNSTLRRTAWKTLSFSAWTPVRPRKCWRTDTSGPTSLSSTRRARASAPTSSRQSGPWRRSAWSTSPATRPRWPGT